MPGAKATDQEKAQIIELVSQHYSVEEIQNRFPHVDGRSISGLHMRHARVSSPGTSPSNFPPPPPDFPPPDPSGSLPAPRPPHSPFVQNRTIPIDPRQDAAETTGFTPSAIVAHNPQGFKPGYREYFVVKKCDPPGDGIMKTEYPPFGIQELMDRYAAGDYEVQHYREGRLFNTYREKIAPRAAAGAFGQVTREAVKPETPADNFLKAMDVYHRMHTEGKQETAQLRSVEAQVKAEEARAKAQVETSATVGLIDLVKELGKPKPTGNEGAVDRIFGLMQEDRKGLETKMKGELDMIREKAKGDLEMAREQLKAEMQRARDDAEERLKRERLFMEKLGDLDKDRQTLWKESYASMTGELKNMQDALSRELEEKRKWLDQYSDIQRKHTDEMITLKKSVMGGGDSIRMAEIVKDGLVQGLDRVGARIDMLADKGIIGKVQNPGDQKKIGANGSATDAGKGGEKTVLSKEAIAEAVKEPWFQDLQDEIARTVRRRKAAADPKLKPHGTLLGQAFLDQMNADVSMRRYMHYLTSRDWSEVLVDADLGIKPENKEVLHDPEAVVWFCEFSAFLVRAWNNSMGVG